MMSTRNLILEMAVYSENDVFAMSPVVSLSSKETEALEDGDLLQYVLSHIQSVKIPSNCRIQSNDIGVVIRHHCGHRNLKKAALLAIPYIMNINLPTAPWRKKTDSNGRPINPKDKRLSGMMSAPILIDGTKYLCNLTAKKDNQGIISPYAITLKDESGDIVEKEKMDSHCQVPNSDSEPTTSGNARLNKVATSLEANPSSDTKIIKESKTRKDMKQNKKTINESDQYAYAIKRIKRAMRILKDNLKDCKISLRDGGTIDIKRPSYLDSQNFRKMVYNVVNSYNLGDEEFRLEDFGNKNTNVLCLIYNDELYSDEDIDKMDSRTTNKPNNEYKWVNKGAEEDFKSNGANSLEKYIKDLLKESKTRKDMKQNKKTINEAQLRAIVSEAVKSVLEEVKW